MAIGQLTYDEAENSMEALREMFNAIAPGERRNFLVQFNRIGTFIQAAQRTMQPPKGVDTDG
jgi:hypothetical protein